jgi:tetratricopeptide (TPR) repeat protein
MQNYGLQYVPKALHSQALAYARLGKMKEAKLALGVAVKQAPDYFAAWKTLVEQQMGLTGIAANETAVDAMIKNSPNTYVLAKACIVRALDGQSTSVTMADCDEAVRLGPDRGFAFYARCFARYELADLANAVADCEAAMKLDPKDVTARYVAGLAKVKMGLTDAGNADIAAAKAAEPDITEPSTLGYPDWY